MTELPGNPHFEAICDEIECGERLTTAESVALEANLAIAFELRTANLIAYIEVIDDTDRGTMLEIKERLGLVAAK